MALGKLAQRAAQVLALRFHLVEQPVIERVPEHLQAHERAERIAAVGEPVTEFPEPAVNASTTR